MRRSTESTILRAVSVMHRRQFDAGESNPLTPTTRHTTASSASLCATTARRSSGYAPNRCPPRSLRHPRASRASPCAPSGHTCVSWRQHLMRGEHIGRRVQRALRNRLRPDIMMTAARSTTNRSGSISQHIQGFAPVRLGVTHANTPKTGNSDWSVVRSDWMPASRQDAARSVSSSRLRPKDNCWSHARNCPTASAALCT